MKRFEIIFTKLVPYLAAFAVIFGIMYFGSQNETQSSNAAILVGANESNLAVTSDQVSESYTVANIASSVSLPSSASISENYVTINSLYETTGVVSTSEQAVIEKPTVIDTSELSRGIIVYTVKDGDTLDSIIAANKLKATKDQIRWSNGLKNEELTVGNTLYLPSIAGITYVVKDGDNVEELAKKYGSNAAQIISYNDLEDKELSKDMRIILPGGTLPETERPEYVKPTPVVTRPRTPTRSYTYSYVTDSGSRKGMFEIGSYGYWSGIYNSTKWQGNPGAFGNCTWFAWYWRRNNMPSNYWLPGGRIGNARDWIRTLGGQYYTGRTPAYGAVFQSNSGYYGHVGVVVGVQEGVSITIQEMNYAGPNGKFNHVYQSTMSWSDALGYNYIYGHR